MSAAEQSRAVCLKLPEIGWKEGEKCVGAWVKLKTTICPRCGAHEELRTPLLEGECYTFGEHDIPPPDLASPAGADLLMTALWKRDIHIGIARSYVQLVPLGGGFHVEGLIINGNIRLALLDAAWRLLCEGK